MTKTKSWNDENWYDKNGIDKNWKQWKWIAQAAQLITLEEIMSYILPNADSFFV